MTAVRGDDGFLYLIQCKKIRVCDNEVRRRHLRLVLRMENILERSVSRRERERERERERDGERME